MEHAQFWSVIDEARASAGDGATSTALARALSQLTAAELIAFDAWFWAYYMAAQREDLWAAVYAIRGGCGDDSFDYFRGWLISRGEEAVLAAVRDPESLAALVGGADPRDESMLGAAGEAYRGVAGEDLPVPGPPFEVPGRAAWPADRFESGLTWDDAFFAAHYPTLYARYVAPK
jgi:Protein of unknown function (DUF4240)